MTTTNQQKYDSRNPLRRGFLEKFQERLFTTISSVHPESILEVGCGEGHVLNRLHQRLPDVPLLGVDNHQGALAHGRQLFPDLQLATGDIYHLDQTDHSWDVAIASEVLEHLDDPRAAIRELRRVAQRYVILSVPHEPWFRLGNLSHGRHITRFGNHSEHVNTWTQSGFARLVASEMTVERVTGSFPWTIVLAKV